MAVGNEYDNQNIYKSGPGPRTHKIIAIIISIIAIIAIIITIIIAAIHFYYYYYYRSNEFFYYYGTFLRLRRECHIQNLFEQNANCANSYQHRTQFDLFRTSSKF
jgi:hypothetical protein